MKELDVLFLDYKRDTFAKMMAAGSPPEIAYNTSFSDTLPIDAARSKAETLCLIPEVKEAISKYSDDKRVFNTITRENIAVKLMRVSNVSACDYYEDNGVGGLRVKPMNTWTRDMREAFSGIKFYRGGGQELKIYSKLDSLNLLMKLMGWDKEQDIKNSVNEMDHYTDAQLMQLADGIQDVEEITDEEKQR